LIRKGTHTLALRAVPDHPKFARLKRLLGFGKGRCLGYLEGVWHFAGRFAPQGNIGKYADDDIESWVEWEGEPSALMNALAESGWIDRNPEHRFIVHDWSQYADDIVHTELARKCLHFADGGIPRTGRLNKAERERFQIWLASQGSVRLSDSVAGLGQTKSDFVTKPVPVPEPVPEPVFDHDMVATAVMAETSSGGMRLRMRISEIAVNAIAAGRSGEYVRDMIVAQWGAYRAAMAKLEWTYGSLEKFLGGGLWQDPKLWPWKDGHGPPKAKPTIDPLAEMRAQRAAAERDHGNTA
jgi:hypothetical protein